MLPSPIKNLTMDAETFDIIEKLKHEKRLLARKVLELSKNLTKMEQIYEDKFTKYDERIVKLEAQLSVKVDMIDVKIENLDIKDKAVEKKFAIVLDDLENLKKDQVRLSDDVSNIEAESDVLNVKIETIDDAIKEIDKKIEAHEKLVENDEIVVNENSERKQCRYNNRGYCRQLSDCNFFHSNSICEVYLETGTCWRQICRQRHPKVCLYGSRCFRGKSCSYLHLDNLCDQCNHFSQKTYYCEFCTKNFCGNCTMEKAHITNIYDENSEANPTCVNIHKLTPNPRCEEMDQD